MHQESIQRFQAAAELNRSCPLRVGNVIQLANRGKVVVAGDLHGNCRNFQRIVALADLENRPDTYVILQEILHGGPEDGQGGCLSFQLLLEALAYQARFPHQVHILLGNHDTAVITDSAVLKAGKEMNRSMKEAMQRRYGDAAQDVLTALAEYLVSQPLAVQCANGIWISHSLPDDSAIEQMDWSIVRRPYLPEDFQRGKSIYQFTWGRRHSPQALQVAASQLNAQLFVLGHQPQEQGWGTLEPCALILASEHSAGCVLFFNLANSYTLGSLTRNIIPLAEIEASERR